jgi:hypothetical protein
MTLLCVKLTFAATEEQPNESFTPGGGSSPFGRRVVRVPGLTSCMPFAKGNAKLQERCAQHLQNNSIL